MLFGPMYSSESWGWPPRGYCGKKLTRWLLAFKATGPVATPGQQATRVLIGVTLAPAHCCGPSTQAAPICPGGAARLLVTYLGMYHPLHRLLFSSRPAS